MRSIRSCLLALLVPLAARAIDATTTFNEVMYHPPAAADAEWIELHNQMAVNMDLSGWRITGGVNYTFPNGTTIAAGGYVVIASNPSALEGTASITGVLGPWTGSLDNGSETIELENRAGREMDLFHYEDSGKFPVGPDAGGVTLAKRQPGLASDDPENWTSSPQVRGTPGEANFPGGQTLGPATTLSPFGAAWNFNQTGANLGGTWAQTTYTAGADGWQSGPGVFAFENDPVAVPVGTVLADPGTTVITHYFQRAFSFTGDPANTALHLSTLLDDGAVVFLNGFEVARINLPAGAIDATTGATTAIDNATVSGPLTLPTDRLVPGNNILSVELHQFKETSTGALQLVEQGGTMDPPNNLARAPGATPFAKDVLQGFPAHRIPHINDGVYGNNNSWIGNSQNSYCAVSFGAELKTVRGIAWGRDNTGTFSDRTLGNYTVQYTTTPNPSAATPESAWVTVGSINYTGPSGTLFSLPSRRHRFNFAPVDATGVRLICPGSGVGSGACVDELELYANSLAAGPPDVVFGAQLVSREIILSNGADVAINEIGGASDAVRRIELRNNSAAEVNVGGLVLAASNFPDGYTLPSQTLAPGALLVLDETQLGFRPQLNDRVFLYNAARTVLVDAVLVRAAVRARSGAEFLAPVAASFGAENAFAFQTGVVINEVMYHFPPNPSSGATPVTGNPEEWIELHNRTAAAIDVSGWSLDNAVEFTFPPGTNIPAGGYLVVAKDASALAAKWPAVAGIITGNFNGSFSNSGERISLKDASGNPADQIRYFTGGVWPSLPDGDGASLELRDPRADNANGTAWAASDESGDAAWQTVTYRMVSGQRFGQEQLWKEFRIGMLAAGECLVDDVSVVRDPDGARQQLIQGGDFETLATKWRMLGNHGASAIETDPTDAANHVLHVRASGQFGYNHNHIESTFVGNTPLVDGQTYEVSFRARYLSGSNQLNTRAYFSRLARTTELALPTHIGTPGAPNSRFATNVGPTMSGLAHAPVLPTASEPVTVRVVATDPDNVARATLFYAVNGSTTFTSLAMANEGSGRYSASIPAQVAGRVVQFYVEAADALGATSQMPAAGPASRALYIVNDGRGSAVSAHEIRVIMLPADNSRLLATLNRLSDGRIPGTAIYRRSEVFYDAGIRLQGTAAGRIRDGETNVGYDIAFPADQLFRGVHDSVNIDRSGRGPVAGGQDEIYVKHMFNRAGVPATSDDLCYFIAPTAVHTSTAILALGGYEQLWVDAQFNGDGTVFNMDGTYEPSTTSVANDPESLKNPVPLATQLQTDFTNLGDDKEQYRAPFEPRAGRRRDDFRGLIAFCKTMALPAAQLAAEIPAHMDIDEWMRCAALYSLCGIGDTYMTGGFAHNLRIHVPSDGRNVRALPWDMDFVFNAAATSPAILAGYNLRRVIEIPANKRLYYGHLHDLCQQTFTSTYMRPWMEHYGAVVGQSMAAQAGYIDARRNSVLAQLPAQTAFAITTNGGAPFTVNTATATLEGTGWINIREFRRADTGAVLPATWLTMTTWRLIVGLNFGENPIVLQAYDFQGQLIGTDEITITSTLDVPRPRDFLRVTELNYHPGAPTGAELNASADKDDFEFIELQNFAPAALDISGCKFTTGIDFTFPANTTLAIGESILVVRNSPAFQARYGGALRVAGAYGPNDSLSNNGETITLLDATGAAIQTFTYSDQPPWPTSADGLGSSLVAIAPHLNLDRNLASSWRASSAIGGNPGTSDATTFTGNPTADNDNDGLSAFLEYALGTSESSPVSGDDAWSIAAAGTDLLFTFSRRLTADDVLYGFERSTDLLSWTPIATQLVSSTQEGAVVRETHRVPGVGDARPHFFVRLRAKTR